MSTYNTSLEYRGTPSEALGVDGKPRGLLVRDVLLNELRGDADHVLALPVLDEVKGLQRRDDVLGRDAGKLGQRRYRDRATMRVEDVEQHVRPVAPVAAKAAGGRDVGHERDHVSHQEGTKPR